jgi:acyl-coenzyme A synthetase/AMP-(fatty) acid ligase
LLNIDEVDENLSAENPGLAIPPDAVASIFYTSGSTGEPKGVMQNHRSILHRVMVDTNTFHICPEDRLSLLSSPSYSVSLRNLFGALLNGATVHPFDIDEDGLARLADWLIQEEITIYFSVPTVFRHFLESATASRPFSQLRLIYLAGEPVTRRDVELYKAHFSHNCILVNSLASNEAGIMRQYFMDHDVQLTGNIVPAGYAVDDKEILILNDADQLVGEHQVGEIAVKSRYLSPGYWRRAELTGAAFGPDPAGGDGRIYRTGDLGCLLPDGCLVYLGRKGLRVKIRGARVELEEVEAMLGLHPAVREVVIETRTDDSEDSRLVAYIVSDQEQAATTSELRHFLQTKLPEYMIPSAFVFLEALPLSPNGKVDRKALPNPGVYRPALETPFVAPRTPVEAELTKIWAEVLSIPQVGVHDDFWELGGHSLAAMRVISRVADRSLIELPMQTLFEAPTVAGTGRELVHYQIQHGQGEELSRLAAELEALSTDEVEKRNSP